MLVFLVASSKWWQSVGNGKANAWIRIHKIIQCIFSSRWSLCWTCHKFDGSLLFVLASDCATSMTLVMPRLIIVFCCQERGCRWGSHGIVVCLGKCCRTRYTWWKNGLPHVCWVKFGLDFVSSDAAVTVSYI